MAVLVKVRLSEVHQFTRIMQHRQEHVCVHVRVPVCVCVLTQVSAVEHQHHRNISIVLQQVPHSQRFCFDSLIFFKSAPTEGAKQGQFKHQD